MIKYHIDIIFTTSYYVFLFYYYILTSVHMCSIPFIPSLPNVIKNKHFWPYTKYNNIYLNYEKPGWPKPSSPM